MSVIYSEQDIFGLTSQGRKIKIGQFQNKSDTALYVGGKIFHIVDGDNGAEYHFYDEYGNEITDIQVGDTPYAYTVSGTASFDKYYIFHNSAYTSKPWSYQADGTWVYESLGTADGIGKGKTNTSTVLAKDGGIYATSETNNIWKTLKSANDNSLNNCSDWFVPSKAEVEALRTATDREGNPLTTLFANTYIWSSFESSAPRAWSWYYNPQSWTAPNKNEYNRYVLLVARAF